MLEVLTLRNFQAHKKLRLELSPEITTITGATDVGKSAIIRALVWIATNCPSGVDFVHDGAEAAMVSLRIDGRQIKRKRGKSINAYRLDAKTFKAFGANVPDDVAKLLNVSDVNFQQQHDRSFWFHLSPPEASKRLNAIIDLGSIDEAQSRLAGKVRSARSAVDFTQQRLDEARAECKKLEHVPEFAEDLERLELLQAAHGKLSKQARQLGELCDKVSELESAAQSLEELPRFDELDALIAECKDRRTDADRLHGFIIATEDLRDEAQRAAHEASEAHTAFHLKTKHETCPLCGNHFK